MNRSALAQARVRKLGALSLALWLGLSWTAGHAQETCERTGIDFGFFNGVDTQERLAQRVVNTFLPEQYGRTTPDGQRITYTLYYNDNQAGLTDFVETFEQRLQEQGGLLAGRFELFFSAMNGGGGWWSRVTEAVPALRGLLEGLADAFRSYLIRDMTADFGNPNTAVVSQRHREQIDHAVAMEKGLLLFAHSQGNLFVNQARDHALNRVNPDAVRVVHVAPASPRATGPHTLASLDIVINLLRTVGTVLPITDPVPGFLTRVIQADLSDKLDPLAHGLLETYLNRNFEPSARIRRHVEQALEELRSPRWSERPPYPEFAERPWTGGPRPSPQVTSGTVSHQVVSWAQTRLADNTDPPGGYRFLRRSAGGSQDAWKFWQQMGSFRRDANGFTVPIRRSESSHTVHGQGVEGGSHCTYAKEGLCDRIGAVSRTESTCTWNHFLANVGHGLRPSSNPIDELAQYEDAAVGTVVHIERATSRPDIYNQVNVELMRRNPVFLTGRSHRVTESRGVPSEHWHPLFNPNSYRCNITWLANEHTMDYATETFMTTPTVIRNLEEIQRWEDAHAQWRSEERERRLAHNARLLAWTNWRATCIRPPPPPGPCTSEQLEDPDADCLRPS